MVTGEGSNHQSAAAVDKLDEARRRHGSRARPVSIQRPAGSKRRPALLQPVRAM